MFGLNGGSSKSEEDNGATRRSALLAGLTYSTSHNLARTVTLAVAHGLPLTPQSSPSFRHESGNSHHPTANRCSVTTLFSMVAERDVEVEDELAKAQRRLMELKSKISVQSKRNFVIDRDVRYLDARIALLIQNRKALDEDVTAHLEDSDPEEGYFPDDRKCQLYGNLFFLLQSEPRHIATLTRLVSLTEIDTLLQTVMFTLYGNQYESREEHLLLTMFQSVLSTQFETTAEFGSLLRANTPVSRMMTTYTRRGPGQAYLKRVVADQINTLINNQDLNLEINPLKVYEQMIEDMDRSGAEYDLPKSVSAEIAENDSSVKAIIQPRLAKLIEIANAFLDVILANIAEVPYGIRWICKQIRSLTKRKYPNATDYSICSLIGGFFFLRFINPAIVTPQAYMLIEGNPSTNPRRTLTLIAKMLQNLANKPSYAKEAYMRSLNSFVEDNQVRIRRFLNDLCEVGDFYESLEMDQYLVLSKRGIKLNITLNEVYNTHSLLLQHMNTLAPSDKDHLRICLNELGPAPAQVPRNENKSIDLPLVSRWETPIHMDLNQLTGDGVITQNDILYMETKSIFVQLLRSMPRLAKSEINLPQVAEAAATSKDATLVRKGIKVKEMLLELEALRVIDKSDNYKLMREEVAQELVHLGNLKEKVQNEIESLENVYKTICDQNSQLRVQLEHYKAYLQNVRLNSAVNSTADKSKSATVGPFKYTHAHLERDGTIFVSNVPENRKANIYFNILSPVPGSFVIALHYKGREKAILEVDLKLDDLLEKQQENVEKLDLEYVQLDIPRLVQLLNRTFMKR